jgi:hypothetical protein
VLSLEFWAKTNTQCIVIGDRVDFNNKNVGLVGVENFRGDFELDPVK